MKISSGWSKIAKNWVGNKEGKHCHWCRFAKFDEGEVFCKNKKSKFNDGDRIRSWDGEGCADECGQFEIGQYYTDDKNLPKRSNK